MAEEVTIGHVKKAENWKDRFTAVIDAPFEWMKAYPSHAAVMGIFTYLASYNEEFRSLQEPSLFGRGRATARSLQPLVESGKLSKVHATELGRTIHAMLTGNITFCFSSDYPLSLGVKSKDRAGELSASRYVPESLVGMEPVIPAQRHITVGFRLRQGEVDRVFPVRISSIADSTYSRTSGKDPSNAP